MFVSVEISAEPADFVQLNFSVNGMSFLAVSPFLFDQVSSTIMLVVSQISGYLENFFEGDNSVAVAPLVAGQMGFTKIEVSADGMRFSDLVTLVKTESPSYIGRV